MEIVETREIVLTSKDIMRYNFKSVYGKFYTIIITIIGIINLLYMIYGIVTDGLHAFSEFKFFNYFITFIAFVIPYTLYLSSVRAASNKFVAEPKVYTFTKQGVHCVTPSSSTQVEWKDIQRTKRSGDLLLLYISASSAFLIPLQNIETPSGIDQIEAWIKEFVPRSAKKGSRFLRNAVIYLVIFLVVVGIVHFMSTQNVRP